jgi:hypothetical protein
LKSNQQQKMAASAIAAGIKLELFGAMCMKKVAARSQVTSFNGLLVSLLKTTLQISI